MPEPEKVAAVRALLPATAAGIYLDAATAGPMPAETQRAMDEIAARELATGRGGTGGEAELEERLDEARASVAAILVADPDDVALTHSAADGLGRILGSVPWASGDRAIVTSHADPGTLALLLALRERFGFEIVTADIGDGGHEATTLASVDGALADGARAVIFDHVLATTGAVLPVQAIAERAHAAGALAIVDGSQAAGAIAVAMDDLGADAYAVPAHAWLLGPRGMGALWVDRRLAGSLVPALVGERSFASLDVPRRSGRLRPDARRFEASGFHVPSVVGFARSCGWLTMYLGLPWVLERAARLAGDAAARLSAVPGLRVLTPQGAMGTIVTVAIAGWSGAMLDEELGARAFAIVGVVPGDAIRISVGCWNTEEEIERFVGVLQLLAGHTPASVPPRRRLTVLGSDARPIG